MQEKQSSPVCVVVGIAAGNGEAFARRFAAAGYTLALVSRQTSSCAELQKSLPRAYAFQCDVTDAEAVQQTFANITRSLGTPDVVIYNAGRSAWGSIDKVTPAEFEAAWRLNAMGLFLVAQAISPQMQARGSGSLIVVGATASRRGSAGMAAFASAKSAQRVLAESLARHLGPMGIHVALMILDGVVAESEVSKLFSDRPADSFIRPEAVAETAYQLSQQHQSAWSFEVELRPFNEKW